MATQLCIKAHRGNSSRVAKVGITTEPPTVQDYRAALLQFIDPTAKQAASWTIDAIYYESN